MKINYVPTFIVKKLEPKEVLFLSKARSIRQPEFFEMLYSLKIDEGISVDMTDKIKYANIFMTAKRYSKLIDIHIVTIKRDKKVIIIRKK